MPELATWVRLAILATVGVVWAVRRRRRSSTATLIRPVAVGTAEGDRATLEALRDAGADLARPTEVNFYLYFPTREAATRAASEVEMPEMEASVDPSASSDGTWCLFLTGTMVPREATIRAAAVHLEALARRHGGDYDGWEARVAD
jgi:hypothetical protein